MAMGLDLIHEVIIPFTCVSGLVVWCGVESAGEWGSFAGFGEDFWSFFKNKYFVTQHDG